MRHRGPGNSDTLLVQASGSIATYLHLLEGAILQPHMTQIAFQATVVIGTQLLTSCSQFIQVISRLMHVGTGCDFLA